MVAIADKVDLSSSDGLPTSDSSSDSSSSSSSDSCSEYESDNDDCNCHVLNFTRHNVLSCMLHHIRHPATQKAIHLDDTLTN